MSYSPETPKFISEVVDPSVEGDIKYNAVKLLRRKMQKFIHEVDYQMCEFPDVYSNNLFRIYNKIRDTQAGTVFFLDRSARPVGWMLHGLYRGLKETGKLPSDQEKPRFINISLSSKAKSDFSTDAKNKAEERLKFDKTKPVMIVDEFSERFVGMRNVDYAKEAINKLFGVTQGNIYIDIYFNGSGVPRFFFARGLKGPFYGIEDTVKESIISNNSPRINGVIGDLRKEYVSMFYSFGKSAAQVYYSKKTYR